MNSEWKNKWIDTLMSGNYKQGSGNLRSVSDNSFCCLGVLCDIVMKEHPELGNWSLGEDIYRGKYVITKDNFRVNYNMLPDDIREFVGMKTSSGNYTKYNEYTVEANALWRDNDTYGKSFEEIAQIIKEVGAYL